MNFNFLLKKLFPFFTLSIFASKGEIFGPISQQDVHLFLSDLELIADYMDGVEKPAAVQQKRHQWEEEEEEAEGMTIEQILEEESDSSEEETEGGEGKHLLDNLYYKTETNSSRRGGAEEEGKRKQNESEIENENEPREGEREGGQCQGQQVGLRDDYLAKFEQPMRHLVNEKLNREIGELVKLLANDTTNGTRQNCLSDTEIRGVVLLSVYLLGYHFTVQLIDFGQRLLSLFSAYHKLHEQLNEGGNALIRKLGPAKMAQKGETIHQMAKHLYSGEQQQDKVIVEQERFLELVEQKWSFIQRIFLKKKAPQSHKYQTKGSRHADNVLWATFNRTTGRTFLDFVEFRQRFKIFTKNKNLVQRHNEKNGRDGKGFVMEINHLADWTRGELRRSKLLSREIFEKGDQGLIGDIGYEKTQKRGRRRRIGEMHATPEFADWRVRGVVTEVKDQGTCGSCWAFAATAALESQIALKKGKLYDLSEQQCLDCSRKYGSDGCAGGLPEACFAYMLNEYKMGKHEYGIDQEYDYPYQESDEDKRCHYEAKAAVGGFKMIGWDYATRNPTENGENGEELLKRAVANIGPIAAVVNVTEKFNFYKDGVFYDKYCNRAKDMHAVTVVGYGKTEKGEEFWLVKNSWGKEWGQNGYVLMARNRGNNCLIADRTLYPIIDRRMEVFEGWDDTEDNEQQNVDADAETDRDD
ncbi:hypothetical protein niasHS_000361 [Heterodera schachtii]|uniref:Uncharacterized protein n=1 Tax=Heterodera schachtii TaxID=97005 RepID=A0ABD2K6X5_HETSC